LELWKGGEEGGEEGWGVFGWVEGGRNGVGGRNVGFSLSTGPATWRCEVVDKHLRAIAPKHLEARIVRVNAEKAPYLVDKLRIRMLPTIVLIKDGKTDHSIIGFDELGGTDDFTTEQLEEVLAGHGVIFDH
jgi:Thioredoxin